MHITQTLIISLQNLSTCILTKMPTINFRHLHQHQQPFDAAPQIRCIPQITYQELEAEEPRAFHKRLQPTRGTPRLFIYLFIYFPSRYHEKSNTDFMFQFTNFHLVLCVSSVHLSSLPTSHASLFPSSIAHPVLSLLSFASNLSRSAFPKLF